MPADQWVLGSADPVGLSSPSGLGLQDHPDDVPPRGSLVRPAGVDTLANVLVLWEVLAEFAGAVARGEKSWWPLLGGIVAIAVIAAAVLRL